LCHTPPLACPVRVTFVSHSALVVSRMVYTSLLLVRFGPEQSSAVSTDLTPHSLRSIPKRPTAWTLSTACCSQVSTPHWSTRAPARHLSTCPPPRSRFSALCVTIRQFLVQDWHGAEEPIAMERKRLVSDQNTDVGRARTVSGINEGPQGPNGGPQGPNEGPEGPSEGPQGPNKEPQGPNEGPQGPNEGPKQ